MGIFDKLKASLSSGKLKKEQLERLRQTLWDAVLDGQINDRELDSINLLFMQSELSAEDFDRLRTEIFTQVVQHAIADRRVGANELASLNHLVERLEISTEVQAWAKRQVEYFAFLSQIENGAPLPVGQPTGLILQKDETCHASLPAQLLEERVVSRNYQGGSRGVSVRVVKGVSFRVGQQKGQLVSQTGLITVSTGYFIVTDRRVVFSGDRKTVATPLEKLLDLHVFTDGLSYSVTNRQKAIIVKLSSPEETELCALIVSRLLNS